MKLNSTFILTLICALQPLCSAELTQLEKTLLKRLDSLETKNSRLDTEISRLNTELKQLSERLLNSVKNVLLHKIICHKLTDMCSLKPNLNVL